MGPTRSAAVFAQADKPPTVGDNDGTKDRRNCYDAVIPPAPKPKAPKVKGVADCRFFKEEDERLACFNGFAESLSKPPKT